MSALRHPVVITSLEEDFQKIGLLKEGLPASRGGEVGSGEQGHAPNSGKDGSEFAAKGSTSSQRTKTKSGGARLPGIPYRVGGDGLNPQSGSRMDPNHDYGTTEDLDEEELEAYEEAAEWAQLFDEEFSEVDTPVLFLSEDEMDVLEALGDVEELPAGVFEESEVDIADRADLFAEQDDDEDDEDEGDDDEDDDDDDYEERRPMVSRPKNKKSLKDDVDEDISLEGLMVSLQDRIKGLQESELSETRDSALPAFANIALVAETLSEAFAGAAESLSDEDYEQMAEGYAEMAKHSAAIVDFLESEEDVDFEAVGEAFSDYVETLMQGVEAVQELATESEDLDEKTFKLMGTKKGWDKFRKKKGASSGEN